MDKELFKRLTPDDISLRVADLVSLFEKVRPQAPSELCAWLVAQELDRVIEREHRAKLREGERHGQVSEKQIRLLQELGVYQLVDLTQHEAAQLIEERMHRQ